MVDQAGEYGDVLRIWHRDSPGRWVPQTVETLGTGLKLIHAADMDADGDPDLLTSEDDQWRWYENDGNGRGWEPREIRDWESGPPRVHPLDLDRDGRSDLLFQEGEDTPLTWYQNTGSAGWVETGLPGFESESLWLAVDGDVDGDGDVDLFLMWGKTSVDHTESGLPLYSWRGGAEIRWKTGPHPAAWSIETIGSVAGCAKNARMADLDNDGDSDVVLAGETAGLAP